MASPSDTELRALLEGTLPQGDRELLEHAIEADPALASRLNELAGIDQFSEDFAPAREPQPLTDHIRSVIDYLKSEGPASSREETPSRALDPTRYLDPTLESDDPSIIGRLGIYQIYELIAIGGMGLVFRGRDPDLQRTVAIKLLSPHYADQDESRQRFLREATSVASLDHPNVTSIYAVEKEAELPFLVMQYIDGETLQDRLDQLSGHRLPPSEIIDLARALAAALEAAHQQSITHRDLKPSNILLSESGVFLTDFGLARAADESALTRDGTFIGTPLYAAPEQIDDREPDHRADLFSLGAVLYAAATGSSPFKRDENDSFSSIIYRIVHEPHRPVAEINVDLPPWLAQLIDKLLEKDPDNRPSTAGEVLAILEGESISRRRRQKPKRQARLIGRALIYLFLASAVSLVALEHLGQSNLIKFSLGAALDRPISIQGRWGLYSSLPTAAAAAHPDDVIQLRFDKDVRTEKIVIEANKPLTFSAVPGFHPGLLSTDSGQHTIIESHSPLTLKGISFRYQQPTDHVEPLVLIKGTSLTLHNCRFALRNNRNPLTRRTPNHALIALEDATRLSIFNSELYGIGWSTFDASMTAGSETAARIELRDSQIVGHEFWLSSNDHSPIHLSIENSVILTGHGIRLHPDTLPAPLKVTAHHNLIQTRWSLATIPIESAEEIKATFQWSGNENLFLIEESFLNRMPKSGSLVPTLEAWQNFWSTDHPTDKDSIWIQRRQIDPGAPNSNARRLERTHLLQIPPSLIPEDSPNYGLSHPERLGPGPGFQKESEKK